MDFDFKILDKVYKTSVEIKANHYVVSIEGKKFEVDAQFVSSNCLSILINKQTHIVYIVENAGKKYLSIGGEQFCLEKTEATSESRFLREVGTAEGIQVVRAPMPGEVIKVFVADGEKVDKGKSLVILEAMKMEHEMNSPVDGYVKKVHVSRGNLVSAGEVLVELKPLN
ncbi:MAG TPA: acetyl-CoA carboxylase biotin carboxyl carrier protein subunit [bacterium (Candidatus Stahlbacteria)]|nr:acetyl-CoA carboxylase biotin carboxyl carrier protein subunit [Candidatus Stahlbacteria bacterium]